MDQARLFLKTVDFKTGDFIPVCDIEITGGADSDMIEQNLRDWLDTVEKKSAKNQSCIVPRNFMKHTYIKNFRIIHYGLLIITCPPLNSRTKTDGFFGNITTRAR